MTRAHERYDEEFRREAIELLMKSGKPLAAMAREMGVSEPTLRLGKMKFIHDPGATGQTRVQARCRAWKARTGGCGRRGCT